MRDREKDRVRADDKIQFDYKGVASNLNDLLGGKIQFDKVPELYQALQRIEAIAAQHRIQVVSLKDRVIERNDSGYGDLQMRVRLPNGHIGELRLHLKAIDKFADYEHTLYEVKRDIEAMADQQNREMNAQELALIEAIDRKLRPVFWDAFQESL
jgi:hypothetical protein